MVLAHVNSILNSSFIVDVVLCLQYVQVYILVRNQTLSNVLWNIIFQDCSILVLIYVAVRGHPPAKDKVYLDGYRMFRKRIVMEYLR